MEQSEDLPTLEHEVNGGLPEASGIFVYTRPKEGGRQVHFQIIGDFDPLAAPAILEIAHKVARKNLGLDS